MPPIYTHVSCKISFLIIARMVFFKWHTVLLFYELFLHTISLFSFLIIREDTNRRLFVYFSTIYIRIRNTYAQLCRIRIGIKSDECASISIPLNGARFPSLTSIGDYIVRRCTPLAISIPSYHVGK